MELEKELSWDEYNMGMAYAAAKKSKDPSSKVGCYIVDADNVKVASGFNGHVKAADESILSWERPHKYYTVRHAEENAIIHTSFRKDLIGATVYVTHGPCNNCLGMLLQAQVKEIIYADPSIMRDRGTKMQKWAINALIKATGKSVRNINGKSYIEELESNMLFILGVGGELESGKSTVAGVLVSQYGFTEKSFAKNLKEMCKSVVGLTEYDVNDTQGKKTPFPEPIEFSQKHVDGIINWAIINNGHTITGEMMKKMCSYIGKLLHTPREVLQFIGTEICRQSIIDSYHIDVVEREIIAENLKNVVVSDARFKNEREWVHSKTGFTILAYNPHAPKPASTVHLSEQVGNPDDYDYTIINDKTLGFKQLYKSVHTVMNMIGVEDAKLNYINV